MTGTAVARTDEPKGIRSLMQSESVKQQILPFIRGENYERVVQECVLAVSANPQLRQCDPKSLIQAIAKGLSWNGVIGEDVHLVPFGDKVTPMKDYKFKARKIVETGAARQVYGVAVYANEPFSFTQGTAPSIQHQVILDEAKRGKMVGAYAVAIIRAGQFQAVSKTLGEIDRIRQERSKSWKKGEVPEWYAIKTVIHQLAKLLPQNAKLKAELEEEERIESGAQVETFDVTVAEPARLTNGAEALPVRGNAMVMTDGYDVIEPKRSEAAEPATDESPSSAPTSDDLDIVTGRPLTSDGQWKVPAGEFRDRPLGSLGNDELLALREALGEFPKKYGGTITRIENLLEDRREWEENQAAAE